MRSLVTTVDVGRTLGITVRARARRGAGMMTSEGIATAKGEKVARTNGTDQPRETVIRTAETTLGTELRIQEECEIIERKNPSKILESVNKRLSLIGRLFFISKFLFFYALLVNLPLCDLFLTALLLYASLRFISV